MKQPRSNISAVDLFCGVGGLSHGLASSGVDVRLGIDIDSACEFPYEANIKGAAFLERDVRDVTGDELETYWKPDSLRLLAGCAPCQPFSPYRRGADTTADHRWPLLGEMGRLVRECEPDFVTMENVPRIRTAKVFEEFVASLRQLGYSVDYHSCSCVEYGLPQRRRRMVLLASRLGAIEIPAGDEEARTVSDVIGELPKIASGESHPSDPLHRARRLSDVNLRRIRASTPGGSWNDWPVDLRAPCHQRATGASFRNVYARMEWDKPAPTITTLFHNFGTGRFGHPEQDRPISIREAAMLQGFPRDYQFVQPGANVEFATLGRLIGNAVPPPIGAMIGRALIAATTA